MLRSLLLLLALVVVPSCGSAGGGGSPGGTGWPAGWSTSDLGAVAFSGSAKASSGAYELAGSGSDIWGTADAFQFASRLLSGDGEISARVLGLDNTDAWAKAGVMIRESLDPGSRFAMAIVTPGNGTSLQYRLQPSQDCGLQMGPGVAAPYQAGEIPSPITLFHGYPYFYTTEAMETTRTLQGRATQGDSDAQFRLGYRYAFSKDRTQRRPWNEIFKWWRASAVHDHVRAQFYLGTCYDYGKGVRSDLKRAMNWYRKAALQGHPSAQYNLGYGYREGQGVTKNLKQAVYWFSEAAGQGDSDAQRDLGYCYHEGKGVRRNFGKAVHWYHLSAQQGDLKAQYNLGLCFKNGDGVTRSKKIAVQWLSKAASSGHLAAKQVLKQLLDT